MTRQNATQTQQQAPTTSLLSRGGILQRKCESCGQHTIAGGECADCGKKKSGLQRKLTIGASNDPLEQEADRPTAQMQRSPVGGYSFANLAIAPKERLGIQAKLAIGQPGDKYEQEADRVADQVMRMPAHEKELQRQSKKPEEDEEKKKQLQMQPLQRQVKPTLTEGDEEKKKRLQMKSMSESRTEAPPDLQERISGLQQGGGHPLSESERAFFEPRFGQDFSQVRIHKDAQTADMAQAVNARAFTVGRDVVFGAGQYQPRSSEGQRLLAHELTHIVQQNPTLQRKFTPRIAPLSPLTNSTTRIACDRPAGHPNVGMYVSFVTIYLGDQNCIDFHTSEGVFRYDLDQEGLEPGEYTASVAVQGNNVNFTLNALGGGGRFTYRLTPDKPNPTRFFARQTSVVFTVTREPAPDISESSESEEMDIRDPNVRYLTLEEAMSRCASGDLPGVKVFPYRGTRFGGAPIMAHRDGNDIIVKQPVNSVLGNSDFNEQTRTLPIETFIGGVRLKPNEVVRVHTYEPRWYHLNITGSTSGDIENEFCVTGEQMLQIAEQSTRSTILNIGLTALDAATLFIPVGRLATMIGKPVVQAASRSARNLAVAIMLGLREASPTAFAGIASRTSTVLVEQQAVNQVASRAVSQTISHATIKFSEQAVAQAAPRVLGEAAAETGTHAAAEVQAFGRFLGNPLSHQNIQILGQLWNNAARAGDNAILNSANSRYLFDLHRNRFWTLVRGNPQARAIFTDAGCQFSGGAPFYILNGRRIIMTIDHIIERQSAPQLALTASNLRISFLRENTVVLRLLNQLGLNW